MHNMWKVLLILTNILFMVNRNQSTANFDCDIPEVKDWSTAYINDPVDDYHQNEFKKFSVKNIEGVEISGSGYGKYFSAKIESDQLIISPTEAFKSFEMNEKSIKNPEMHVRLDFKCTAGERHLSFHQPIRDNNTYTPIFEQPLYIYNLPMPLPAEFDISTFGSNIIACDLDISNVHLNFTITPAEDFYISWYGLVNHTNNKCHRMMMQTINPLRLTSDKIYEITVTDIGIPPQSKLVEFHVIINEETSLPQNPYFDSAYYNAVYHSSEPNDTISIDKPISLKEECSNVKFDILELEYQDKFRVGCNVKNVTIELVNNLPNDVLNNSILYVTIQATVEYAERSARTVLKLYIPEQEHLETSTVDTCNMQCSPCPPTPNTTCEPVTIVPYPQSTLHYMEHNYVFTEEYCHIGYIDAITVIALPKENIEYFLPTESRLFEYAKNSGVLRKINCVAPNSIYYFKICAEGITTKSKACANVVLSERGPISDALNKYVMLVVHIVEEREGIISLPCNHHCTCAIFEQFPEINEELFMCESEGIYASAIDREMEEIANMQSPQFTLQLALKGLDSDYSYRSSRSSNNSFHSVSKRSVYGDPSKEEVFIPSKVFEEYNRMLLTIIIDDINDNPPSFKEGSKLVLGYPVKPLAILIAPPYLAKVVATDPDAGENATIRYNISTKNPNVLIHPETGVIYICKDGFDDESSLKFNVTATDRNGAPDGLATSLEVEVKLLTRKHILVMKLSIMLEDVDRAMDFLSRSSGLVVKYLTAKFISVNDPEISLMKFLGSAPDYFTRILVYGLNSENEPIHADDLASTLRSTVENKWYTSIWFENIDDVIDAENNDSKRFNTVGCIIIPAILLLLLVILIIATGGYYHYKK